jgi:hypothetical protein
MILDIVVLRPGLLLDGVARISYEKSSIDLVRIIFYLHNQFQCFQDEWFLDFFIDRTWFTDSFA